jgi:hypothetical protein
VDRDGADAGAGAGVGEAAAAARRARVEAAVATSTDHDVRPGKGNPSATGSKNRKTYTLLRKFEVIQAVAEARNDPSIVAPTRHVATETGISHSNIYKWDRDSDKIIDEVAKRKKKDLLSRRITPNPMSRTSGLFPDMERELYAEYKKRRARGRRCSSRWFRSSAKSKVHRLHITGVPKPRASALRFRASKGWFFRFCGRWKLVYRKVSNKKSLPMERRKGLMQNFLREFRRYLWSRPAQSSIGNFIFDDKRWGRFAVHRRFNVDQVPLPFINGSYDHTWEDRAAKRVQISNPLGDAGNKRSGGGFRQLRKRGVSQHG